MRKQLRLRRVIPAFACTALAVPAAAQVIQHCVQVTHCVTVRTEIFGLVLDEEKVCDTEVICHYHIGT